MPPNQARNTVPAPEQASSDAPKARTPAAVHRILQQQRFAVLATAATDAASVQPYTSVMAFIATPDLRQVVVVTDRRSHKYANIRANPRVALCIDDRANDPSDTQRATVVTATGTVREAQDTERQRLLALYVDRHPYLTEFVHAPECALLCIDVGEYYVVDHFQRVSRWCPQSPSE
jgi:nitroimidazol reductase NimA-like FMN-containing flavoprotein (pyridoxamine 5'-phosphate oxidase superfamily)